MDRIILRVCQRCGRHWEGPEPSCCGLPPITFEQSYEDVTRAQAWVYLLGLLGLTDPA
ncbi:MAG TPA: hypothetical protein VG276_09325 [Actinomycetes bacterium]|jgi:hypothetical protein|nr:hypothetical protein [Actinomycetes bacterium]